MERNIAQLVIRLGAQPEQKYPLINDLTTLGRESLNDIVINDPEVSRRHARILTKDEGYLIEDLGSTNGSFVNGQRVTGPTPLYHGDTVELGQSARVVFLSSWAPAPEIAETPPQEPIPVADPPDPIPPAVTEQIEPVAPVPMPVEVPPPPTPGPDEPPIEDVLNALMDEIGQPMAAVTDDAEEYYTRPETEPLVVAPPEEAEQPRRGCRRFLPGCLVFAVVFVFLLAVAVFALDTLAPDWLYCGPMSGIWNSTLEPILNLLGRSLACP